MNALDLAMQHVIHLRAEAPTQLADTFARELLDTQRRLEIAKADIRKLVHERDRAEEQARRAESRAAARIWPVAVRCDGSGCPSALAFDPMPAEDALAQVLFDLRWRTVGGKHYCPRYGR